MLINIPPHPILIVDDSPLQAIVLRRILVQANCQTLTAKDGVEALECLKKGPVSLIVSDITMPNMDGFEFCKRVKEDKNLCHIPIILCTALTDPLDLIHGIEVGADNYITRPYNEASLFKIMNELLQEAYLPSQTSSTPEDVLIEDHQYRISASRQHILNFLISSYRNILQQNKELNQLREEIQKAYKGIETAQKEQEKLLYNIFPEPVANELIAYGSVTPVRFEDVSIMFVDFVGFSKSAKDLDPQSLIQALEYFFEQFDLIIDRHNLERIKTIGDGYMCVGGMPTQNTTHPIDCVLAALEIQKLILESIESMKQKYNVFWQARVGINTGPVVAGVIGKKRFAYDIWGDTVNLASRMESNSEAGRINISKYTYKRVLDYFNLEERGSLPIKNKEGVERFEEMYFVGGVKPGVTLPTH